MDFLFHQKPTKKVALTFDDGPRPASTRRLRRLLHRHQVPASFFIVGHMAVRYPEEVRGLARDGHEIANHSWSHPDLKSLSKEAFLWELEATRLLIEELTHQKTWYFRTPGSTESYIRRKFEVPYPYKLVLWDVHSLDHEGLGAEAIFDRVYNHVSDGDVILLHNGLESTVQALDCLIPALKSEGFEFVTLSTLFSAPLAQHPSSRPVLVEG